MKACPGCGQEKPLLHLMRKNGNEVYVCDSCRPIYESDGWIKVG
jgi:DNA-directed RNA polymerase subunit M/transcription elongation factor TFIIS